MDAFPRKIPLKQNKQDFDYKKFIWGKKGSILEKVFTMNAGGMSIQRGAIQRGAMSAIKVRE